jgi:hypothetical protein
MTRRRTLLLALLPQILLQAAIETTARISTERTVEGALRLALSPLHLPATPGDSPGLEPGAAALLNQLLDSVNSTRSHEHWTGSPESLRALQDLISGGRALAASFQAQQQSGQQSAALGVWLGSSEQMLSELPPGPSYPQLRRAVVAVLLELWLAAGSSWRQVRPGPEPQLVA